MILKRIAKILIKSLRRIIDLTLNILIIIFSLLIPKTEKIIVVGGWFGKRFADNSKYFFLYANANKADLGIDKVVWITRNDVILKELRVKGFNAYKAWSFHSVWYHLRAKFHLIDQSIYDINPYFSVRSKRIDLWHGFPLKKIGTYIAAPQSSRIIRSNSFLKKIKGWCIPGVWSKYYVLATSEYSAEVLGKSFDLPAEKMIISGYPRNYEAIVENPITFVADAEVEFTKKIKQFKENGYDVIGYFPTFRDKMETQFFGTQDKDKLDDLFDFLLDKKIIILGKLHFAVKDNAATESMKYTNYINLPPDSDLYPYLKYVDILITDYSSIYFDFLLWQKPMIFFPYDLEYYTLRDRGLIFDYDTFTPGPKVYNIEELKMLLKNGSSEFMTKYFIDYSQSVKKLSEKLYDSPEQMEIRHLIKLLKNL